MNFGLEILEKYEKYIDVLNELSCISDRAWEYSQVSSANATSTQPNYSKIISISINNAIKSQIIAVSTKFLFRFFRILRVFFCIKLVGS